MEKISLINGPNINMLGVREREIYGDTSLSEIEKNVKTLSKRLDIDVFFFQSNHQGVLVDFIQQQLGKIDGIVINPAAYSKNGYAILEAILAINVPYIEVHLSNIFTRGGWHKDTIFSEKAIGCIIGFGEYVYEMGVMALARYIRKKQLNHN